MDDAVTRTAKFLEDMGWTRMQAAARLGCDPSLLSKILHRRKRAGGKTAKRLERASRDWAGGQIRTNEWAAVELRPPSRAA